MPCFLYCCQGHAECARCILALKEGRDIVNFTDALGMTALHYASYDGHAEIVKDLLEADASIMARDIDGCTCLMIAKNQAVVEVLLEQTPDGDPFGFVRAVDRYVSALLDRSGRRGDLGRSCP